MAKTEITGYRYDFRNTAGKTAAVLLLQNKDDLISMVAFVDDDEELPPPREGINGVVYMTLHHKWLSGVIDMLRNEEPVYFLWNRETESASVTTEEEPVGEEEHKGLFKYLFG